MGDFPDIADGSGYSRTLLFPASSSQSLGQGRVVQYRKEVTPRRVFRLEWTLLSRPDANALDSHVQANFGPRFWFHFYDWRPFWWRFVPVGLGDGATSAWDIPVLGGSEIAIFVDGATQVYGAVAPRGGTGGVARVTLYSPPAPGKRISAAFYGRRRFAVRYRLDKGQPVAKRSDTARARFQFATELITWKTEGVF